MALSGARSAPKWAAFLPGPDIFLPYGAGVKIREKGEMRGEADGLISKNQYISMMYTCIHVYAYTPIHVYAYTRIHVYTYTAIHVYAYTPIHVYAYTCIQRGETMKVVAIISQKGGVGKTTLATALAVAAEREGRSAALFDLDPQASASFWRDTREALTPAVVALPPARLPHMLKAAAQEGCHLAIIDAPPFAKDIAFEAAQQADFILIPTRPAVLDVMAMTRTVELVRHYGKPSAVVLTFCPIQGRELIDTENAVHHLGIPLAPMRIHNRVAFSRAQQTGQTAQELEPDGKAAEEIKKLYAYSCSPLFSESSHG